MDMPSYVGELQDQGAEVWRRHNGSAWSLSGIIGLGIVAIQLVHVLLTWAYLAGVGRVDICKVVLCRCR